tara:strand:+ start:720 stop:1775 length:1056 start_codon:yes stop_codon:yes gene_type:complete
MYKIFKSIAFKFDAEFAHHYTVKSLSLLPSVFSKYGQLERSERFQIQTKFGSVFFPIGIAAGLDKNAELIDYFGQLGAGALEVGTVTPRSQGGNPRPRLFRIPKEKSLRNCMGFNSEGSKVVISNINSSNTYPMKLGVNFGKNKETPNEKALEDYLELFSNFEGIGDYYVINVSSPNTPGLRDLQDKVFLKDLAREIKAKNVSKPIYLKVSPDMDEGQLKEVIEVVNDELYSGIVATNTSNGHSLGPGGLSGGMIREKSSLTRRFILENMSKDVELIGVGGVESISDLWEFWQSGGRFMQIYTSFVYQGPKMLSNIASQIDVLMNYYGVFSTEELIRLVNLEKVKLPKGLI